MEDVSLLERICEKDIKLLQGENLITEFASFKCTGYGDAMARYHVKFETMRILMALPPKAKMSEMVCKFPQGEMQFLTATDFGNGSSGRVPGLETQVR